MPRKVFLQRGLPVDDSKDPPTVDAMRQRLGGRVSAESGAFRVGSVVDVETRAGTTRTGVVLCALTSTVDVLLERGLVKRTHPSMVTLHVGSTPRELADTAAHASVFATLFEGQAVHIERGGGASVRGVLREKCRYGALVEGEGGAILGVGFQRLWPAPKAEGDPV